LHYLSQDYHRIVQIKIAKLFCIVYNVICLTTKRETKRDETN